jgi:hypothetical protein
MHALGFVARSHANGCGGLDNPISVCAIANIDPGKGLIGWQYQLLEAVMLSRILLIALLSIPALNVFAAVASLVPMKW